MYGCRARLITLFHCSGNLHLHITLKLSANPPPLLGDLSVLAVLVHLTYISLRHCELVTGKCVWVGEWVYICIYAHVVTLDKAHISVFECEWVYI